MAEDKSPRYNLVVTLRSGKTLEMLTQGMSPPSPELRGLDVVLTFREYGNNLGTISVGQDDLEAYQYIPLEPEEEED